MGVNGEPTVEAERRQEAIPTEAPSQPEISDDSATVPLVVSIFGVAILLCLGFLAYRYCKGRGQHTDKVVEPRRVDRQYSKNTTTHNATQALPYQTEDVTVEITSGRK